MSAEFAPFQLLEITALSTKAYLTIIRTDRKTIQRKKQANEG